MMNLELQNMYGQNKWIEYIQHLEKKKKRCVGRYTHMWNILNGEGLS
jgi:hypothetical protein